MESENVQTVLVKVCVFDSVADISVLPHIFKWFSLPLMLHQ